MRGAATDTSRILNCSFGIQDCSGYPVFSAIVQRAAAEVTQAGAIIVAAAGNKDPSWSDIPIYPASYNGLAISVGGSGMPPGMATNGSFGVDFAQRASFVIGLGAFGLWPVDTAFQATSAATALVSGDISLLMAYAKTLGYPSLDYDDVLNLVRLGSKPYWEPGDIPDPQYGWGVPRLDGSRTQQGEAPYTFEYMEFPNTFERFSQTGTWGLPSQETVKVNLPGISYGQYNVTRWNYADLFTFPQPYYKVYDAWANGRLSSGAIRASYAPDDYNGGTITSNQCAEVLSFTNADCVVRTCKYDIAGHGSWPLGPNPMVTISVFGELLLPPTSVTADYDTALGRVSVRTVGAVYPRTAETYNYKVSHVNGPWTTFASVPPAEAQYDVYYTNLPKGSDYFTFGVSPTNVHQSPAPGGTVSFQTRPNSGVVPNRLTPAKRGSILPQEVSDGSTSSGFNDAEAASVHRGVQGGGSPSGRGRRAAPGPNCA